MRRKSVWLLILLGATVVVGGGAMIARASSHREAPLITEMPAVDGTDFYMFNSYEPGRAGFVTIVADYYPLQDSFAGPNYFELDPAALYEILIDNNGDAKEEHHLSVSIHEHSARTSHSISTAPRSPSR